MGEKFSGYENVATTELARQNTYNKHARAYALTKDEGIIRQARDFIRNNKNSKDPRTQGMVDGFGEFLRSVRKG